MSKFIDLTPKYHDKDPEYDIHGYVDYVKGVLDGSIVACEYIRLACQRTLDFDNRDDMYFDVEDVDSRIRFIWKLKHSTGQHNHKHFRLLPWQLWLISQIFGWKWKDTGFRVTRKVFLMISRKNGKTSIASALSLAAMIGDKESGQEIDLIANNSRQAGIAFEQIKNYCESIDPQDKVFKRYRSEIRVPMLKSKIQVLSSESMGLDGYNSSVVLFDEFHAQKDWNLYNVMKSSQGAREQPLMIVLTTAGFLIGETYPCYSTWETCIEILRREKQDDTYFSAIYQLDPTDDWEDEDAWIKCSPSLDQTVFRSFMRDEIAAAKNNTALENGVRTKTLNEWRQAENVWLPHELIKSHMQPLSIEEMKNLPNVSMGYIGVDLSAVSDLTALTLMVESDGKFYFKSWAFVPEECLQGGVNAQRYREWANNKYIDITPGNVQDYDYILDKIVQIDKIIPIAGIFYDTWNAIQFAVNATNLGLPMFPYSQALGNFNRPTKQYELLLKSGRVVMDYNPAVLWCFASSTLKQDFNGNCKPIKADKNNGKIDMVIAMLESLGGYYLDNAPDVELTAI
jgi:phage terminase large subunit-like protein